MIIAIDGPAATGKSTSAKLVAEKLDFTYLDTGAMYRCVTLLTLRNSVKINSNHHLDSLLKGFQLDIKKNEDEYIFYLNGEDVSKEIRRSDVTKNVSAVSALLIVRKTLVKIQRKIAEDQNCVVEGRDIGTVVFPNADVKFFVVADLVVRAKRRQLDLKILGEEKTIDSLIKEIHDRDRYDSQREVSPLSMAIDAIEVDTTNMSIDEQVDFMVNKIKTLTKEKK
ncbi:MAG: cytidylate kinase [Candidatus Marinimicrobia bacterium]|nr:cytidylate kinase [Candidatus Neomarinimicrobiota bacterium]|tara:strand:- start:112 stop:783 length:672 start_codon:yes stop_codon:yes gene_type:complete